MLETLTGNFEVKKPISYEVTDDFTNLGAVGAIVLDPMHERVLLVRRLVNEKVLNPETQEEEPIDKTLKNKVDQPAENIILALPSGSGALNDFPNDPVSAVRREVESETGSKPAFIREFHTYQRTDIPDAKKVGFYIVEMSPNINGPENKFKDWPGWFPIELVGTVITLPYGEHQQVILDFIREQKNSDAK